MQRFDKIWLNARLATLQPDGPGLSPIDSGAIASSRGRIAFVGGMGDLPTGWNADEQIDCEGRWITPGLIDCHTHLVHGGNRSREFELRLKGATYEAIAQAGGGILSTVNATRASSEDELVASALLRLDHLLAEGVTTVEVKSGYGLELDTERRMLRAARRLAEARPVRIRTTFLGAHALPPEAGGDRQSYIDRVCRDMIPAVAGEGLADAVDAFCEGIAFSPDEVAQVFAAASDAGLPVKLHADQLSDLNGGGLAARHGALSADHLEYASEESIEAMRRSGTVAVLLPGAFYTLRETKVPPVAAMRRHGVPLAVGTDCNPGTSPLTSILTAMNMAATLFRLTPDECLAGVTREAARALGILDVTGTLSVGKQCDLAIWNIEHPAELAYRIGFNPLYQRVWGAQCQIR